MNIAHIESSLNWGGQELRTVEQCLWLLQHGHSVHLIARPDSVILDRAKALAIPVLALDMRGSAHPVTIARLVRYLKTNRVELVDAHSNRDASYAMFAKWLTQVAVVRSRHVSDPIKRGWLRDLIWHNGSHRVITTAQTVKEQIVAGRLAPADRVDVALAGVCPKRFRSDFDGQPLRRVLGIAPDAIVIANVGMIRKDKGLVYLVEAMPHILERYPNVHFIQVGEATAESQGYKEKVVERLKELNVENKLTFCGYQDDVERYIALADIVVIASIGTEAQTRLVPQCFLSHTVVVATTTGGLPEMIRDQQNGLLVAPQRGEAIADACIKLVEQPQLRRQLVEIAAQEGARDFSMDAMMEKMLLSYQHAIETKQQANVAMGAQAR